MRQCQGLKTRRMEYCRQLTKISLRCQDLKRTRIPEAFSRWLFILSQPTVLLSSTMDRWWDWPWPRGLPLRPRLLCSPTPRGAGATIIGTPSRRSPRSTGRRRTSPASIDAVEPIDLEASRNPGLREETSYSSRRSDPFRKT